ncbi:ADA regulatory protein [Labilithrix luteola]|uniref:DNA-3-methyladenine glycosylase II n=2 Tax=Labilithrix luteola TaxID=1391654 RepID=A0A0K1PV10_9BACT|nr:ADA regulatory protein [Labilithrix luteola]
MQDADARYQAMLAHDRRFDGVFFVGVSTTGVYCRPVCRVKTPRRSSCTFYESAAAAEKAGYRPCMRCRPELAPGRAHVDAVGRLAALVVDRIEDGALDEAGVEALATELGISSRHLRRACESELGVSPVELAQTQRLLLAKRLLTDTTMPVTEVAFASGFASLRRFNALFRERYRLAPSDLRKQPRAPRKGDAEAAERHGLVFELAYRPPYDWPAILGFFGARASAGVELVSEGRYARTFRWLSNEGWLAVSASDDEARSVLRVELSESLKPAVAPALARVKRAFDLAADPIRIAGDLGKLAEQRPGLRLPGSFDAFELAVRAILGQQVTVKGATTLASRFSHRFGKPIATPFPGLERLTPTPEHVAEARPEEVAGIGLPLARAKSIVSLAAAVRDGKVSFGPRASYESLVTQLVALPGIGEWTAEYVAMRALGWPDAFPSSDLGVLKALGETSASKARARAEAFRPWRSYATLHLWESLSALSKATATKKGGKR